MGAGGASGRFEIVLAHLDGYVRVKLRGDLDYAASVENAETLKEVTDLRERVVLDMSEVVFMDSAGLRFILAVARRHDGPLRIEHASRQVRRVFELTGLAGYVDLA